MRLHCLNATIFSLTLSLTAYAETTTLEQAWTLAYRNNPSLEAQRASLRAIDEQVSQALSNWRPSIDATGSVGHTNQYAPELAPFEDSRFSGTARSYGVQLKQPLFRGFRTRAETEAAEKQVLAGRAKLESAEQQLFIDTATAYLGVLRDEAIVGLERNHESILEDKLKETGVRAKLGELTQTDVRQAESRLARAHVAYFQAESTLTQDRASYLRLVGATPDKLQPPAIALNASEKLDRVFQQAETQNPDVVSAQYAVEDVLNAEQELLDAEIDQVKSQHDRDLAVLQIRQAEGTLTASNLALPVEPYDPKLHYDDVRNKWIGFSKDDTRYKVGATTSQAPQ